MSEKTSARANSAQAINDLLSLTERRQPPNWLLTYIDVFVLIVMLVVTLVSLSTFETPTPKLQGKTESVVKKKHPEPKPEPIKPSETITAAATPEPSTPDTMESAALIPEEEDDLDVYFEDELLAAIEQEPTSPDLNIQPTSEERTEPPKPEEEASIQQQLSDRLKQLGLDDSINMTVTQDYAQLEIQDNILYRSSEANLTENGQSILTKLTPLLKQTLGLIYIEGHTDNRPINTLQFPSNWELGAARAASVLHFLASKDIAANRMRAVSYADTQPVAENDSDEGRQKNRRVNIVIKLSDRID